MYGSMSTDWFKFPLTTITCPWLVLWLPQTLFSLKCTCILRYIQYARLSNTWIFVFKMCFYFQPKCISFLIISYKPSISTKMSISARPVHHPRYTRHSIWKDKTGGINTHCLKTCVYKIVHSDLDITDKTSFLDWF